MVNKKQGFLIAVAVAGLLSSCAKPAAEGVSSDPAAEADKIGKLEMAWAQKGLHKSPEEIANYYAVDAVVMEPGAAPLSGLGAIQSALADADDSRNQLTFHSDKVLVGKSGEVAYSRGSYQLKQTDPKSGRVAMKSGQYLTVFRKEPDGSWKAIEDIST